MSYPYCSCDVTCGGQYVVETVLYDVPSVVAVVSGFYCRRMDYGVLVVGGVSWELCRVLRCACPVLVSVLHSTVIGILWWIGAGPAAHAQPVGFTS